jgi:hypothetical protein
MRPKLARGSVTGLTQSLFLRITSPIADLCPSHKFSARPAYPAEGAGLFDLVMIVLLAAAFAAALGYVWACADLTAPSSTPSSNPSDSAP